MRPPTLARGASILTAAIGCLALLGWALGNRFLSSLGAHRIPMAPDTALLFIFFGAALLLRATRPQARATRVLGLVTSLLSTLTAVAVLLLALLAIHPGFEHLGFAVDHSMETVAIGHMSPVTAACLLLATLSFLASAPRASAGPWRPRVAWMSATSLLAISFVLLLAYLLGAPLFYGGAQVPPAATTVGALTALSVALLALSKPPMGLPRPAVWLFMLIGAGIASASGLYLQAQARHYRAEVERQLLSIAELRARELTQWRRERLADASLFLRNAAFSRSVQGLARDPRDARPRAEVLTWLTKLLACADYDRISLLDARGVELLSVPSGRAPLSPGIAERVDDALRRDDVVFEDFHRNAHDQRVYLNILVPIRDERRAALGAVSLRIDPTRTLYPLIDGWPTPARTAETVLLGREGDQAVLLNDLRAYKDVALRYRLPLREHNRVAVQAVLGQRGILSGGDYFNAPVLAAASPVPDSPWFLIARMSLSEVNAPLYERLWLMALIAGGLWAVAAAGVALFWREQRLRHFRERYEAERAQAWLREVISRSLNEIFILDGHTLRYRFANRGACRNLQYTEEELQQLSPLDIVPGLGEETFRAALASTASGERTLRVIESTHRRKDGTEYPVELHLQAVDAGDGIAFVAVANDISERRRADARIRHLNRVYAVLLRINEAIVRVREPQALLAEVCRVAVETGGFKMAWIGLLDEAARCVRPATHAGATEGYLDRLDIFLDSGPRSLGPTACAAREGRHDVCNDIAHDPRMAPWRADALARGYRASAAFPLVVDGKTVGTLNLYAGDAGAFDSEELELLDDLTMNLSFAIEKGRGEQARLRLSKAIEQAPVSVVITDAEGRVEYVNPAFMEMTGFTAEEVLGAGYDLLTSHVQGSATYAELAAAAQAGRDWHGELATQRKDGGLRTQQTTVSPVHDASGRITHFVSIGQDVTERRRAEEAARKERAFSEAIIDSLPGVFYVIDQSGRLLRWNRSLEVVTGRSGEELQAIHALALVHAEDRARAAQAMAKVFASGGADVELSLSTPGGQRTPYYLTAVRIVADGVPRCIGTGIDLTVRKRLEEELQQSQKIEAIGRLAGGVAHDFNNILGVIMGHGELVQLQLAPSHPLRVRVDEMMSAAERAATLTRQLLAFSRKQVLQPKLLNLNEVIAETSKMLSRLIGEDVALLVRPASELGAVMADPGQIGQILMNLATNARDAMPGGGTLTIETANADFDERTAAARPPTTPGRYILLAVSDTGVGMNAETQRRVFEPFFTTKPEGLGTGLGLATVYGIVKQSGGYIWVYSEPGQGTTFKIYLPRVERPLAAEPARDRRRDTPHGDETLLLVEDSEALRQVTSDMLESFGYTVLPAQDGEQALALARAHPAAIDLLLTDVVMPRLGGVDLAAQLTASRPSLRVLFMSGYTDGSLSHQGVLGEGMLLLSKPFTTEQLARAVREALDRPRAR